MNSFCERFFVHRFCYVLPSLRLHGAEHDACSAQWCHQSSGQQVFPPVGPMDVIVPPHPGPFYGGNGPRSPPGGPQNQGAGHPYVCGGPLSRTLSDTAPFGVGCTRIVYSDLVGCQTSDIRLLWTITPNPPPPPPPHPNTLSTPPPPPCQTSPPPPPVPPPNIRLVPLSPHP